MPRIFFIVFILIANIVKAQNPILVKLSGGKILLPYTVQPSESIYSIARNFSIQPKDLATANSLNLQQGLVKGSVINLPIASSSIKSKPCDTCTEVRYTVQPKDALIKIFTAFGYKTKDNIFKLNNLTSDNVQVGQQLIVGYMPQTQKMATPPPTIIAVEEKAKPMPKNPLREDPPLILETQKPAQTPVSTTVPPVEIKQATTIKAPEVAGFFADQYNNKMGQNRQGAVGVFKSISGWADKKFYALISGVEAGTILRIINMANGRTIYAKTLGALPITKGSETLLLRINDAALAALAADENAQVSIFY